MLLYWRVVHHHCEVFFQQGDLMNALAILRCKPSKLCRLSVADKSEQQQKGHGVQVYLAGNAPVARQTDGTLHWLGQGKHNEMLQVQGQMAAAGR
jgi:hypothetical protein